MLRNRVFVAVASRSGFGAAISDAVARSSIVLCNSVSADRIVVAASRLLGGMAACVILLLFAAGHRKSYWSGIWRHIFAILALVTFLVKTILKSASKSFFLALASRYPVFELQVLTLLHVVLLCFATQRVCRSHCSGCVKVARCCSVPRLRA